MKMNYDPLADLLTIESKAREVAEGDESKPGVTLDFDAQGHLAGGAGCITARGSGTHGVPRRVGRVSDSSLNSCL